jgi:hypothetical protein
MVNDLAQQASGFWSNWGKLHVLEKPDVLICHFRHSSLQPMHSAEIWSAETSSVKSDAPELETGGSGISRGSDDLGETAMVKSEDWRAAMVRYLENHGYVIDRKVHQQALKYVLLDHDLYRRTIDDLLLRCLSLDQSKVAMGESMMKYAPHINQLIWDDWLLWPVIFLSWLYWKIVLDTIKIANHARKSKTCNWCLLPCCVPSLSEGHFVIEVYTSLTNHILYFVEVIDFSGHISGQRVFILLCGLEHAVIEIANS